MTDLRELLLQIVASTDSHARWLNTFSYLEYVGFRKIVKSQEAETMSSEILNHALEEGRHAALLKRATLKIGGARYSNYRPEFLLCATEAKAYFQSLDQFCASRLKDHSRASRLSYLYVTWLVEVRALEVYQAYNSLLQESRIDINLNGLLAEEQRHLESVEADLISSDPAFVERRLEFRRVECHLYQNYLAAVKAELKTHDQRSAQV